MLDDAEVQIAGENDLCLPPPAAPTCGQFLDRQSALAISLDTLCVSALLQFDLYCEHGRRGMLALYRSRAYPLTQADLDQLRQRGIRTLFIQSHEAAEYRDYLQENVLKNESIPPATRYHVLREATRSVFLDAVRTRNLDHSVEITEELGQQMVETICRTHVALIDLVQVMSHDYGTFTHAMNVATYSLLLARALGIQQEEQLMRIGQGALLHDIGKQYVAARILDKKGPLNDQERQLVMKHPARGFRELCYRDDLAWGQLMMIYQHHERCDGRGYPGGLHRGEIHEYARLCSIADVCDALMRDRPYRKASLRGDVVEYLDRQAGRGFDEEMVRCWITTVRKQS